MIRLNETAGISRSPGDVFAFLADLTNFPQWRANLVTFNIVTPGPTDVGTRCTEVIQVGPMRVPGSCDVTEFSPGRTLGFRAVSAGLIYDGRILVERSAEGSKLTLAEDVELSGVQRLMRPFLRRRLERGIRKEAASIKHVLEHHHEGQNR